MLPITPESKKFYVKNFIPETAIALVVGGKVFVEILGMGDWAPLLAPLSRATPLCLAIAWGGFFMAVMGGARLVGRGDRWFWCSWRCSPAPIKRWKPECSRLSSLCLSLQEESIQALGSLCFSFCTIAGTRTKTGCNRLAALNHLISFIQVKPCMHHHVNTCMDSH